MESFQKVAFKKIHLSRTLKDVNAYQGKPKIVDVEGFDIY